MIFRSTITGGQLTSAIKRIDRQCNSFVVFNQNIFDGISTHSEKDWLRQVAMLSCDVWHSYAHKVMNESCINFQYVFECTDDELEAIMSDVNVPKPVHNELILNFYSDKSWDSIYIETFNGTVSDIINYSPAILKSIYDEMIEYQRNIINQIINHAIFKRNALIFYEPYRHDRFLNIRNNTESLCDLARYYIESMHSTYNVFATEEIIEKEIGYHFLKFPDLYFELITFYKLKGMIHE